MSQIWTPEGQRQLPPQTVNVDHVGDKIVLTETVTIRNIITIEQCEQFIAFLTDHCNQAKAEAERARLIVGENGYGTD